MSDDYTRDLPPGIEPDDERAPGERDIWEAGYTSGLATAARNRETLGYAAGRRRFMIEAGDELDRLKASAELWRWLALGLAGIVLINDLLDYLDDKDSTDGTVPRLRR